MANTYKNIVITPNRDTDGSIANVPIIRFSGGDATLNTDINLRVYTAQSGTLSFEGSAGQLFSITNDLTNSIFSVNDVSGIPSIDVYANGDILLAPFGGQIVVGNTANLNFDTTRSTKIVDPVANTIAFHTAQAERVRIDPTGNLIIGRTNSTVGQNVRLDVNGAINASAVLVNGAAVGGGGLSLVDQTASATVHYPTLTTATTGTISGANTSSTKLSFVPSTGTLSATIFNSTSDENYKKDINTLTDALEMTAELRGVSFKWKDNDQPSIGLIAQEVEKVVPEVVTTTDGKKTLNYDAIIGLLVESIKELKARVEKLENNG